MKKILTLFSLALGLFLFTTVAQAQDKEKITVRAKKEALSLSKTLNLDKEQLHEVAENLYTYYLNTEKHLSERKLKEDKEAYVKNRKKLDQNLFYKMEKILSPRQMKRYKSIYKKEIQ